MRTIASCLLDFGFAEQFANVLFNHLLLQTLRKLRFGFLKCGKFQVAHVFEQDDVVTEVGFDRHFGVFESHRDASCPISRL